MSSSSSSSSSVCFSHLNSTDAVGNFFLQNTSNSRSETEHFPIFSVCLLAVWMDARQQGEQKTLVTRCAAAAFHCLKNWLDFSPSQFFLQHSDHHHFSLWARHKLVGGCLFCVKE